MADSPSLLPGRRWRVAASDLDDTLLCHDGSLAPRTEAAVAAWLADGRRFVIATGRPPRSVGERLPAFLHDIPWICYNGAEIRLHGCTIYRHFIPEEALTELIAGILDGFPDTTVGIELDDMLLLNRPRAQSHPSHRVVDLRSVAHRSTAKVLLFSERLEALIAHLSPLPPGVRLMGSGRYPFVQLMADGADKVTALRHLLAEWGEPMDNVVAFGDDINDVDLLREAGLGVAVANAFPAAREACDLLTASNEEAGVAQVLEAILAEEPIIDKR